MLLHIEELECEGNIMKDLGLGRPLFRHEQRKGTCMRYETTGR